MSSELWNDLVKFLTTIFAIVSVFGIPIFLVFHNEYQKAGLVCFFSIILLLTLNADRIEAFKLWGLEAKLKMTIIEANATIGQLKGIAAAVSKATLTNIMADNFFDGMPSSSKLKLHEQIIQALEKIDLSESEILAVNEDWNKGVGVIYHRGIRKEVFTAEVIQNNRNLYEEYNALLNFQEWNAPSADAIEGFLKEKNILINDEAKNLIEDYRFFIATGKIKNVASFARL